MTQPRKLRIQSLVLNDIGGFGEFGVEFSPSFNLICGANGVGKTTILYAIARAFSRHPSTLRRRAASLEPGRWHLTIEFDGKITRGSGHSEGMMPFEHDQVETQLIAPSRSLLHFKANRDFFYSRLEGIGRDPATEENYWSSSAVDGIHQDDIKRWLVNRYLFSAHPGSLTIRQLQDLEFSKECFSILDPTVEFDKVDAGSFDVYVHTPQGSIPYEYLSSGFRASLAMLLGIVREIEIRNFDMPANQFNGVILIDELDLHLHPTWQRQIVQALKKAFSSAQFIVTTHSPHMIQAAELGEVIALLKDNSGNPRIGKFHVGRYGFKGWTLEEILRDVMGLQNTQSDVFTEAMLKFDEALDSNSGTATRHWLNELESMLKSIQPLAKTFTNASCSARWEDR